MSYHVTLQTVLLCLLLHSIQAFDSEGRNFIFLFARNSEQATTNNTRLWVTLINRNANPIAVAIDYPITPDSPTSEQRTSQNAVVPANNFTEVDLPSSLGWDYTNTGFQKSYDTRVFISSNASITVLANNQHQITQQMDTFIVYPREFVSTLSPTYRYAVSVPKPTVSTQFTVFAFIPLTGDFTLTLSTNQGRSYSQPLTFQRGSFQYYYGVGSYESADPIVYASGDKPFAMMVAVSCAPTSTPDICDHAAFMPQPVASDYFDPSQVLVDHHITDLLLSQMFYIVPPRGDIPIFSVSANVTRNGTNTVGLQQIPVDSSKANRQVFVESDYGDIADIESGNCLIQVNRLGNVPKSARGGVFLTAVPAWSQTINEAMSFVTRFKDDQLMCFIDSMVYVTMKVDDTLIINDPNLDFISIKIDTKIIWLFALPITNVGYHTITFTSTPGMYTCYVMGNANTNSAYGYVAAFNRQQVILLPNVTTTTSTTTTTTTMTTMTTSALSTSTGTTAVTSSGSTASTSSGPSSPTMATITTISDTTTTGTGSTASTGSTTTAPVTTSSQGTGSTMSTTSTTVIPVTTGTQSTVSSSPTTTTTVTTGTGSTVSSSTTTTTLPSSVTGSTISSSTTTTTSQTSQTASVATTSAPITTTAESTTVGSTATSTMPSTTSAATVTGIPDTTTTPTTSTSTLGSSSTTSTSTTMTTTISETSLVASTSTSTPTSTSTTSTSTTTTVTTPGSGTTISSSFTSTTTPATTSMSSTTTIVTSMSSSPSTSPTSTLTTTPTSVPSTTTTVPTSTTMSLTTTTVPITTTVPTTTTMSTTTTTTATSTSELTTETTTTPTTTPTTTSSPTTTVTSTTTATPPTSTPSTTTTTPRRTTILTTTRQGDGGGSGSTSRLSSLALLVFVYFLL